MYIVAGGTVQPLRYSALNSQAGVILHSKTFTVRSTVIASITVDVFETDRRC
jgi:hypothetical protein